MLVFGFRINPKFLENMPNLIGLANPTISGQTTALQTRLSSGFFFQKYKFPCALELGEQHG